MNQETLARIKGSLDLRLYAGLAEPEIRKRLKGDLSGLASEHEKDGLRVKPYEMRFNALGEPNFNLRWETETDFQENEAVYAIGRMAREGNKDIIWISPPSEKVGYEDSRFVVVKLKSRSEEEVVVEARGIYGVQDAAECLAIARSLGVEISDKEKLRETPIAFKPDKGKDWIDYLEARIKLRPGVWRAIRRGEDLKLDNDRERVIVEIIEAMMPQLRGGFVDRMAAVRVGVELETRLESRLGIQLLVGGSCDKTNRGILQMMSARMGAFEMIFGKSRIDNLNTSETFDCPKCNGKIPSGKGIETCPHCGLTKEEAGNPCV